MTQPQAGKRSTRVADVIQTSLRTSRVWAEFHAGNLTRAARDVLLTLRTYRGHGGLICPAHATLATRANCHAVTVWRALQAARDLGPLDPLSALQPR
jgi:hypothetical protein